jgi:hypothetical protein
MKSLQPIPFYFSEVDLCSSIKCVDHFMFAND